ncbi:MAG: C-GCAxxG-C-C family protein [Coriobacteriia bacterium]|nr:C-GCAxxG-C-C family protein [Coriobacteriia bacterium]
MSEISDCTVGCDARDRFTDGRNCTQAVLGALSDLPGVPALPETLGAGFTTGIGGSGCVCGALVGGVAMLSEYASTLGLESAATRELAGELSADLHSRFTKEFRTACCRVIKRGQVEGSDEWLSGCAHITEMTARMVADIVAEQAGAVRRPRWAFRDALSTARRVALGILSGGAVGAVVALVLPASSTGLAFALGVAAISVLATALELGGATPRRGGRALRSTGATAAALLAIGVLLLPDRLRAFATILLTPSEPAVAIVRVLLVGAMLAVAATGLFGLKRYR